MNDSTRDLGFTADQPIVLLHESGPIFGGQNYRWTQTYRVGIGQSERKVRLILDADCSYPDQSRIRSEVWMSGRGWRTVLEYAGSTFGPTRLPNGYSASSTDPDVSEAQQVRAEAILEMLLFDVLRFLGMS